jgi:hypothetical protein
MYLRRLRTLADTFLAGGRLRAIIDAQHAAVRSLAKADAALWGTPDPAPRPGWGDVDDGHTQLTTEWLPQRREQLLGSWYGPGGERPLLPPPQAAAPRVALAGVERQGGGALELRSGEAADVAVDVSGWKLRAGALQRGEAALPSGAVIPPGGSLFLAADVRRFLDASGADARRLAVAGGALRDGGGGGGGGGGGWELLDASGNSVARGELA